MNAKLTFLSQSHKLAECGRMAVFTMSMPLDGNAKMEIWVSPMMWKCVPNLIDNFIAKA